MLPALYPSTSGVGKSIARGGVEVVGRVLGWRGRSVIEPAGHTLGRGQRSSWVSKALSLIIVGLHHENMLKAEYFEEAWLTTDSFQGLQG